MAGDSQTTDGVFKTRDAVKIRVLKYAEGEALIGQAGYVSISKHAISLIQERVIKLKDPNLIPRVAREVIAEIRSKEAATYGKTDSWSEDTWRRFNANLKTNHDFDLMIAFYDNDKPRLCTISLVQPWPNLVEDFHYATIGLSEARTLAEYLLGELSRPGVDGNIGIATAIYSLEKSIKSFEFCGLPIKAAWIEPKHHWDDALNKRGLRITRHKLLQNEEIDEIIKLGSKIDDRIKKQRIKLLQNAFRKAMDKFLTEYTKSPEDVQEKLGVKKSKKSS